MGQGGHVWRQFLWVVVPHSVRAYLVVIGVIWIWIWIGPVGIVVVGWIVVVVVIVVVVGVAVWAASELWAVHGLGVCGLAG